MRIEHVALWTADLERLKAFYSKYFDACAGHRYVNAQKQFTSYFLKFPSGARLELMHQPDISAHRAPATAQAGYAHIAFALGSEAAVDALTERLRREGHTIADGPRRTGDGYYESVVLDPDGNRLELTV